MAVPKKRTGKAKQASRRAKWKATVPATTTCKKCGEIIPTHTICPKCGYYKNELISKKKAITPEAVEEKQVKTETAAPAEAVETAETVEEKPKTKKKTTAKKADSTEKKAAAPKKKAPAKTKKAEKKADNE